MWWKIGIGLFLLFALLEGGDAAQLFIGVPLGLMILFGAIALHEKLFEGKKNNESILSLVFFGVMTVSAVLFSFWLTINFIQ